MMTLTVQSSRMSMRSLKLEVCPSVFGKVGRWPVNTRKRIARAALEEFTIEGVGFGSAQRVVCDVVCSQGGCSGNDDGARERFRYKSKTIE